MSYEQTLRECLIETCKAMSAAGLSHGTSGNVSVRLDKETILVSPTGLKYESLRSEDVVAIGRNGIPMGKKKPSSEWRIHYDVLTARPEMGAVVHCHSPFATVVACHRKKIPAFHYMVCAAGGADIRCAPYATFGTQKLSDYSLTALEGRKACLMANHGQLALGKDLEDALSLAGEVENLASIYWRGLAVGEPFLLDSEEVNAVLEKFVTYGQQD